MILIYTCSVCTTVILGGNDDLAEESRLVPVQYYSDVFLFLFLFSLDYTIIDLLILPQSTTVVII